MDLVILILLVLEIPVNLDGFGFEWKALKVMGHH